MLSGVDLLAGEFGGGERICAKSKGLVLGALIHQAIKPSSIFSFEKKIGISVLQRGYHILVITKQTTMIEQLPNTKI